MKQDVIQMEIIANFHPGRQKFSHNYNQILVHFL